MWTYWGKGVVGSELVSSFCSWWGLITCLHNGPELEGDVITTELSPCLIPWNIWRPAEVKPYVESPQWAPWWIFKPVHRSARMWEGLDEPLVFKHLRDSQAWFIKMKTQLLVSDCAHGPLYEAGLQLRSKLKPECCSPSPPFTPFSWNISKIPKYLSNPLIWPASKFCFHLCSR